MDAMMSKWRWLILVAVGLVVGLALWGRARREGWTSLLQGDPQRGGKVFFDRGCASCHAISGTGGKTAPDLSRAPEGHLSFTQLVGVMWNHAPSMWDKMRESGAAFPALTERDLEDVFAYLYVLRYMDRAGDPGKGGQLLRAKGCVQCHAVQGEGGTVGPDLSRLSAPGDPISWAQRIWNHAAAMEKVAQQKGVSWPEFEEGEMGDLLAYLRGVSAGPAEGPDLLPANPDAGRDLFSSKGCVQCHAVRGQGGTAAPDLGRIEGFPRTFISMVGLLWNHAPRMSKAMRERGVEWPLFSEREMADLVAYLSSVRYFDEPGRVAEGQKVFSEKRCDLCHAFNGEKREGPDLGRLRGRFSSARMAYTMWAHGPQMLQKMKARNIPWSLFKGREMADLIAYLNAAEGR